MEEIWLIVPGADEAGEGRPAFIEAETTAAELLHAAGLNPRQYQLRHEEAGQVMPLGNQDRVAEFVGASKKIYAVPHKDITVG